MEKLWKRTNNELLRSIVISSRHFALPLAVKLQTRALLTNTKDIAVKRFGWWANSCDFLRSTRRRCAGGCFAKDTVRTAMLGRTRQRVHELKERIDSYILPG
jgi:hypothetical protein